MSIEWDYSDVNAVALDLSKAPGRLQRSAPKVFARGAFETKGRIQRDATGHRRLAGLPARVSYDKLGDLDYEIGFDKEGQGNLAVFAVHGSIHNAPVMSSPAEHLRRELPEITRHLGTEAENAVFGGRR